MADHPLSPTIPVFQPGGVNQGGKGVELIKLPGVAVSFLILSFEGRGFSLSQLLLPVNEGQQPCGQPITGLRVEIFG